MRVPCPPECKVMVAIIIPLHKCSVGCVTLLTGAPKPPRSPLCLGDAEFGLSGRDVVHVRGVFVGGLKTGDFDLQSTLKNASA